MMGEGMGSTLGAIASRPRRLHEVSTRWRLTASETTPPAGSFSRRRRRYVDRPSPGRRPPPRLGARADDPAPRIPGGTGTSVHHRDYRPQTRSRGRIVQHTKHPRLGRSFPGDGFRPEPRWRHGHNSISGRLLRLADRDSQPLDRGLSRPGGRADGAQPRPSRADRSESSVCRPHRSPESQQVVQFTSRW